MTQKPSSRTGEFTAASPSGLGDRASIGSTLSTSTASRAATGQGNQGGPVEKAVAQTQEQVGQVVDQAQEQVGQAVDQAKQTATSQVATQKDRAAQALVPIAQALRQTGQELRGREQATIAEYVDTAAQQVERFYAFLHEHDVNQIVGEVERFARRRPGLFLGSTFALGLLGSRFLKSSAQAGQASMEGMASQQRYPAQVYPRSGQIGTAETFRSYGTTTGTTYQPSMTRSPGYDGGTNATPAGSTYSSTPSQVRAVETSSSGTAADIRGSRGSEG